MATKTTPTRTRRATLPNEPRSAESILAELDGMGDEADEQERIDQSVTPALELVPVRLHGLTLRPFTLSAVMLLHGLQNEIITGRKIRDMANPIRSAMQFLYVMDDRRSLAEVSRWVNGEEEAREAALLAYGETLAPSDSLVVEIIEYINDQTSTRVNAKVPKAMAGEGTTSEKNV
jgi:hypothetical protein